MGAEQLIAINFSISADAWAEIGRLQEFWNETCADTADALMIGWGRTELHSGASWDHVVVSFYGRSERSGIADAIQRLDGRDVVFFVLETDSRRFAGKVIDFQAERGFFLS